MKKINLENINTEKINSHSKNIDLKSTSEIIKIINEEDQKIALIIKRELYIIAEVIDEIFKKIQLNGRIVYLGAGSSGRIAVLDASEMLPTYGIGNLFYAIIAGGDKALKLPIEGAEDDRQLAVEDLQSFNLTQNDVVFVIGASGRTPYCIEALEYGNQKGCLTIALSMTKNSEFQKHASYSIEVDSGPEVIAGSTRMKAGSATKMVLNMISTTIMIKMGKVFDNLMVEMAATNQKLKNRCVNMIKEICQINDEQLIIDTLVKANMEIKPTILMLNHNINYDKAKEILKSNHNNLRKSLVLN